jgi:hypothetical protein
MTDVANVDMIVKMYQRFVTIERISLFELNDTEDHDIMQARYSMQSVVYYLQSSLKKHMQESLKSVANLDLDFSNMSVHICFSIWQSNVEHRYITRNL